MISVTHALYCPVRHLVYTVVLCSCGRDRGLKVRFPEMQELFQMPTRGLVDWLYLISINDMWGTLMAEIALRLTHYS